MKKMFILAPNLLRKRILLKNGDFIDEIFIFLFMKKIFYFLRELYHNIPLLDATVAKNFGLFTSKKIVS